jgi:hypothetical protein
MPYTLKKYNGQTLAIIADGTLDTISTSLQFPGRNYAGYGFSLNQSLSFLLENFANSVEPANKITGQLWFDTSVKKIKVYNGINFKTLGAIEYGNTAPGGQLIGDMWFNTTTNQLFVYDGANHKLIGPNLTNPNAAQLVNKRLIDTGGNSRTILQALFNEDTIAVFSKDEFDIKQDQTPITGFSKIYKGITLPSRAAFPNVQFAGVAKTSESLLVGSTEIPAANFLQNTGSNQVMNTDLRIRVEPNISNNVFSNFRGLFLGAGDNLYLGYNNGVGYISNLSGPGITFSVTNNSTLTRVAYLDNSTLSPVTDSATDIGTSALRWKDVYANNFYAIDDPNRSPNNAAFRGRVEGTVVNASIGFNGNLTGNVRGDIVRDNGDPILTRSGFTPVFNGRVNGPLYGNVVNLNAVINQQIAVDVSNSGTIFRGTLQGVAQSASALSVGGLNRTAFVGTPSSTVGEYRNTVAVRDTDGNLSAVQFLGLAQSAQAILDENSVPRVASASNAPFTVVIRQADGSINVGNIAGTATDANRLTGLTPSASAIPSTIAARDAAGDLYAGIFHGRATSANYADLAEKYLADAEYDVGTVMMIGGEKEVTASRWGKRAIGAVSEKPAYLMNSGLVEGTAIALKGRVPVKVIGAIKKGDELIASDNGCAVMAVPHSNGVFAVALEDNSDTGVKLVECLIL